MTGSEKDEVSPYSIVGLSATGRDQNVSLTGGVDNVFDKRQWRAGNAHPRVIPRRVRICTARVRIRIMNRVAPVHEHKYEVLIQAVTSPPCGRAGVRHQAAQYRRKTMHTTHSTFSLAGHTLHRITFDPTTFTDADLLWLPTTPSWLTPDVNARLTTSQDASPPRTPCLTTPFPPSAPAGNRSGRKEFPAASPTAARRR